MNLNPLFQMLVPREKKFFPLFEKASANLSVCAKLLYEMVTTTDANRKTEIIREIEKLEHVGDEITHQIFHELGTTFITPFDREDIHALASAVDDVLDFIHGSSKRMELYKVNTNMTAIIKLSELTQQSVDELHKAIIELKNMKKPRTITDACVRINSIENHADDVFDNAVAKLFDDGANAIEIIKYKEILQSLEMATDKCEDAANVLESIIVKNA